MRFAAPLLALAVFLASRPLRAETFVLYGQTRSVYELGAGFPLPVRAYRNAGFEQRVARSAVELVATPGKAELATPHPFSESSAFLEPIEPLPAEALAEVRRLGSSKTTRRELVEAVLDWITERVESGLGQGQSQAPLDVLGRGRGNCVGMARTAIAMLRAAGIPARSVHAYQVRVEGGRIEAGAFHRLLEVEYPGIGWIGSDVGRTKNFMPPDLLVLDVEGEGLAADSVLVDQNAEPYSKEIRLVRKDEQLLILDWQSWPRGRDVASSWTVGHRQFRSSMTGKAPAGMRLVAEGSRGLVSPTRAGEWFAFAGLLPGQYTILAQEGEDWRPLGSWGIPERQLVRLRLDEPRESP